MNTWLVQIRELALRCWCMKTAKSLWCETWASLSPLARIRTSVWRFYRYAIIWCHRLDSECIIFIFDMRYRVIECVQTNILSLLELLKLLLYCVSWQKYVHTSYRPSAFQYIKNFQHITYIINLFRDWTFIQERNLPKEGRIITICLVDVTECLKTTINL